MKLKSIFMLVLASVVFAACDNNDEQDGTTPGTGIDPQGDAWVSLQVSTKSTPSLRSLNNPDQDAGTATESAIKSVKAIFFDGTTDASLVTTVVDLSTNQMGIPGATGVAGEAFKVPATSQTILLVANAPSSFTVTPGTAYSTVNQAIVVSNQDLQNTTNTVSPIQGNSFMMTNAKGGLEPSLTDGTTTTLTLHPTQMGATLAPLAINIDRVVSKVRVYITPTADDTNITISNAGWLLNVTNTKYFPVAKRTKTGVELRDGLTLTPFDAYGFGSYRIDPNYDTQATTEYFNLPPYYGGNWNADKAAAYCLENTQDQAHNKQAYTTQAVIRAKYTPTQYYVPGDADGVPSYTDTKKADWILLGGKAYTPETIVLWITEELKAKYLDTNGIPNTANVAEGVSTPITTALNGYLTTIGEGDILLPADVTGLVDITTLAASFTTKLTDVAKLSNRATTAGSLTYYANAYNYYKVMIKHDNDDAPTFLNQLGEFGVVRNSVYDIHVSKFSKPGFPTIPEPKEDEDDEDDLQWISVQININPWTWYTQTEEL